MNMTDWNNMLDKTRAAITGYELALDGLIDASLLQAYVVVCQDLPLAFDLAEGGAFNPRTVPPQLATRFTLDDAARVACQVQNGNGIQGEVVHIRHAIATALAGQRELLAVLLEHSTE
jgi:hypothetical protein